MLGNPKLLKGTTASHALQCAAYPDKEKQGEKDDYYEQETCQQNWGGSREAMLALGIDPDAKECNIDDRIKLMMGQDLKGNQLRQNQAGKDIRFGYDLTLSAPKSVSTIWAGTKDESLRESVLEAHKKAVSAAMQEIQEHIKIRTGRGGLGEPEPAEIVFSSFHHGTSRALDPQLHTHNVVYNLAMKPDGKFKGIDISEIYQNQKYLGTVYRAELAKQMKELGFSIEAEGESFKVIGVPDELCDVWSKRSNDIKQEAAKRGAFSAKTKEQINLAQREKKIDGVSADEERKRWLLEAEALGYIDPVTEKPISQEYNRKTLFELITEQNSTFTENDLKRELAKYAQWCGQGRDFIKAELAELHSDPNLVKLRDADPSSKTKAIYSTHDMINVERKMVDTAIELRNSGARATPFKKHLKQFQEEQGFNLSDEQVNALKEMTREGQFSMIRGVAGAGKTTSAEVAYKAYKEENRNVIGLAIAAKAARGMNSASDEQLTMAKFLHLVENGKKELKKGDVLILDEAGMVGSRSMNKLIQTAKKSGAKLICIGDEKQIQAIEAGGAFKALMTYAVPDYAEIKTIMRQKEAGRSANSETRKKESELHLKAVTALENGFVKDALDTFKELDCVQIQKSADTAAEAASDAYFKFRKQSDETQVIVTAANHADVNKINAKIREELGITGTGQQVKTEEGIKEFAEGDRIIFRKNRPKKGESEQLTNGDLGTIVSIKTGKDGQPILIVQRDLDKKAGKTIEVDTAEYKDLRHGYAMTVHASQGVTVERAVGVANANSALANQNIMYVQASRHKLDFALIGYAETDPDKVNERLDQMLTDDIEPETPEFERLKEKAELAEIEDAIYKQYSRSAMKNTTLDFLYDADTAAEKGQDVKQQVEAERKAEAEAEAEQELEL